MTFRSIDIDFDVHKKIELERRSFMESPNDVLRRLLALEVYIAAMAGAARTASKGATARCVRQVGERGAIETSPSPPRCHHLGVDVSPASRGMRSLQSKCVTEGDCSTVHT